PTAGRQPEGGATRAALSFPLARPNRVSAVGSENTRKAFQLNAKRPFGCAQGPNPLKRERLAAFSGPPAFAKPKGLLEFGIGAGVHPLLDCGFGVGLVDGCLDVLGSAVVQVLGFLLAQTGQFAHGLGDADLVGASF